MDATYFYFDCDIVSHLQASFFWKFSLRTLYGRNSAVYRTTEQRSTKGAAVGVPT
jgi:hypothetical protein